MFGLDRNKRDALDCGEATMPESSEVRLTMPLDLAGVVEDLTADGGPQRTIACEISANVWRDPVTDRIESIDADSIQITVSATDMMCPDGVAGLVEELESRFGAGP